VAEKARRLRVEQSREAKGMWDPKSIVERMQFLAAEKRFPALAQLCESPEVRTIAKVAILISWGLTEGVEQLLAQVIPRSVADKHLSETEIMPSIVDDLAAQDIVKIGQFLARSEFEIRDLCHRIGHAQWKACKTVIDWHVQQHEKVMAWPARRKVEEHRRLYGHRGN